MATMKTLIVSSPPHIYGTDTIERRMRDVLIALSPAFMVGIAHFGFKAFYLVAISVVSALLAEYLFQKVNDKPVTINDCSAAITGLLLAFNIPSSVPFWLPAFGSFFAIIVVKQLFGGLGSNFMNPALAARAFLLAAFPVYMTNWTYPDAISQATYLGILKETPSFIPQTSDYLALLSGNTGGCIGETSAVARFCGRGIQLRLQRFFYDRGIYRIRGAGGIFVPESGRQARHDQ